VNALLKHTLITTAITASPVWKVVKVVEKMLTLVQAALEI